MSKGSVAVLGGDLRQYYLAKYMAGAGHEIICFGIPPVPIPDNCSSPGTGSLSQVSSLKAAVSACDWILGPMPFSRDGDHLSAEQKRTAGLTLDGLIAALHPGQILVGGGIPENFSKDCARKQITVIDLMDDEALARANAALTAEGLLSMLIANTPFSLTDRRFLILGFGRCGQEIAWLLSGFSAALTAYDHDPKRIGLATLQGFLTDLSTDYDIIINTIPAQVLTRQQLAQLPDHCTLFDIASAPFGFDPQTVRDLGLSLIRCPGIPGAMMPQTAGELLGKSISERMLSHGF